MVIQAEDGKSLSVEVAVMLELQDGKTGQLLNSISVSLLDWYDLQEEQILVLERPIHAQDLFQFIEVKWRLCKGGHGQGKIGGLYKRVLNLSNADTKLPVTFYCFYL